MKKSHVLFVTEKWTDGDPSKSLSNSHHNLFGSLEHSELADFSCLHFDEHLLLHGQPLDNTLIQTVDTLKPEITMVTILPCYEYCPTMETYKTIADKTKLIFVWPDSAQLGGEVETEEFATLIILWDADRSWKPGSKYIHLWTPQDPRIYNNPHLDRNINVSFIGDPIYYDRRLFLNHLSLNNIHVHLGGGKTHNKADEVLSASEYANLFQRSKITLNFSLTANGRPQLKGRPLEAMLCGAMVMESKNQVNWLERWFMPYVHYIPFKDEVELKNQIEYFLTHDKERIQIAENGHRYATEWYNNVNWWKTVFREVVV